MSKTEYTNTMRPLHEVLVDDHIKVGGDMLRVRRIERFPDQGISLALVSGEDSAPSVILTAAEDHVFTFYNQVVKASSRINKKFLLAGVAVGVGVYVYNQKKKEA